MVATIADIVTQYLARHPFERERLGGLSRLIAETDDPYALIARTNFAGHVTASGFVVTEDRASVLLVHHRALNLYVQPGGHLEPGDVALLEGARREVREETGLRRLRHLPAFEDPSIPFDIDTHFIPANASKGEPEHWHHDVRYTFVCTSDDALALSDDEVTHAKWVSVRDLGTYPTLESTAGKLAAMLERNAAPATRPAS